MRQAFKRGKIKVKKKMIIMATLKISYNVTFTKIILTMKEPWKKEKKMYHFFSSSDLLGWILFVFCYHIILI